jgi:ketosteroid isomerase-like protein
METGMAFADEVAALEARFLEAYQRGDAAASVDVYTEDAVYVTPGKPPVRGRKAIEAVTTEDIVSGLKITSLNAFHTEKSGDLGYVLETCSTSADDVTTMLALRRDPAGGWRICAEAIVAT